MADISLIGKAASIPAEERKEKNSLGVTRIYYRAGSVTDDVTVFFRNGVNGGTMVTEIVLKVRRP